jgi:hypothetical protein
MARRVRRSGRMGLEPSMSETMVESPSGRLAPSVRVAVLASAVALMIPGAWGHSATMVELGHLPSGLAAWQRHSLGMYRVCGPLSKLLYALPAYLAGVRVDYPAAYDADSQGRWEWQVGFLFQKQHPHRFLSIFRWSRILPILVTVLGAWLVCEWSTRLFGTWPGIASLCAWSWTPLILGHGALTTSDLISAVTLLLAARTFWSFLLQPGPTTTILAGLALGAALATKFTLLVLYPCWVFILVGRALQVHDRGAAQPRNQSSPKRLVYGGLLAFLISLMAVDGFYCFQGVGFRLSELKDSRSSLFRGLGRLGDRPEAAWMLEVPLPVPREFVRGLDSQLAEGDHEDTAYLLGETRLGGWWYWYLAAALIKIPVPALGLFALALYYVPRRKRESDPAFWAALCTLIPAGEAALAIMASTGTGTNAAFRYMIPSLAMLCVWAGLPWRSGPRPLRVLATGLLAWLAVNAVLSCPDPLGWRNELGWTWEWWSGRPALIGDSLDWGQDLSRLGAWVSEHSSEGSTVVCVFGQGAGEPYGLSAPAALPTSEPWRESTYVAVGANCLFGYAALQGAAVGGRFSPLTPEQRGLLLSHEPCDHVGRTIRIYRVRDLLADF